MGLDTTHNAWHGPYGSFNHWRRWVAKQIGIDLDKQFGFGGENSWDNVPEDFVPLLNHSDCDGELTVKECLQTVAALNTILDKIKPTEEDKWYLARTIQFVTGCLLAIKKKQKIEFH